MSEQPCNWKLNRIGEEKFHVYVNETDLEKMTARECDWNFCALHEMGHMFDFNQPWKFEAEVMTDATNQKKFEDFVAKLSLYGSVDVKSYFSTEEWNVIINKTNS